MAVKRKRGKFRKDLWRKMKLKVPPPLKSVPHYLVKSKWSTISLYSIGLFNSVQCDEKCLITVNVHKG